MLIVLYFAKKPQVFSLKYSYMLDGGLAPLQIHTLNVHYVLKLHWNDKTFVVGSLSKIKFYVAF